MLGALKCLRMETQRRDDIHHRVPDCLIIIDDRNHLRLCRLTRESSDGGPAGPALNELAGAQIDVAAGVRGDLVISDQATLLIVVISRCNLAVAPQ
jgi:hypothetical protein